MLFQVFWVVWLGLRMVGRWSWVPSLEENRELRGRVPVVYSTCLGIAMEEIPELPHCGTTVLLFLTVFVGCGLAFTAVYPFYFLIKQLSHIIHNPKPLTKLEKSYLKDQPTECLADSLEVVGDTSLLTRFLASENDLALCIERTILVTKNTQRLNMATLRHEATHALQFRFYGGFIPFCALYFAHQITYWIWFWSSTSWILAYAANPLEVEAHANEIPHTKTHNMTTRHQKQD